MHFDTRFRPFRSAALALGIVLCTGFSGCDSTQHLAGSTGYDTSVQISAANPDIRVTRRIPYGWRRTNRGWEHTSTWGIQSASINDLIAAQQSREPAWIRFSFEKVRAISPITIALIQLWAIAVIFRIAQWRRLAH